MHEHALQPSVGVGAITEFTVSVADCTPPGLGKLPYSLVLSQGSPAVMNVQDEDPAGAHEIEKGLEHGASVGSAMDHPQGAKQADSVIDTLFGKAAQFDQVCLNGKYGASSITGHEFSIHDFEHGATEVDPNDVITTFCQRQSGSAATASEVENDLGSGAMWPRESLIQDLLIETA